MKVALVAVLAVLALAFAADPSFAAKKKMVAGSKCQTGASCSADCENGWCSRYVCVGGKWEKRLPACNLPVCGPKC